MLTLLWLALRQLTEVEEPVEEADETFGVRTKARRKFGICPL